MSKTKTIVSILVILVLLACLGFYISKHTQDFIELVRVASTLHNFIIIIVLAILSFMFFILNGFQLDTLMRPFGIKLKIRESLGLAIITNFYNTILPARGGMIARGIYLKKKHNFAYVNFLATLAGIYVIIFLISSLLGVLTMLGIHSTRGIFNPLIFTIFTACFLFLLSIIIFSPKLPKFKNKWVNRFCSVINGWHLIKNNKRIILTTSIIAIIQILIGATSTILAYSIFNIHLSFLASLFIVSVGNLAMLISITPGNLGVGDAISVFSASVVGVSLTGAVAAVVLGRAISLIVILILGPLFSYILLKKQKEAISSA